jgi:hypothetical protein
MTRHPRSRKARAVSRPKPDEAPVIRIVCKGSPGWVGRRANGDVPTTLRD